MTNTIESMTGWGGEAFENRTELQQAVKRVDALVHPAGDGYLQGLIKQQIYKGETDRTARKERVLEAGYDPDEVENVGKQATQALNALHAISQIRELSLDEALRYQALDGILHYEGEGGKKITASMLTRGLAVKISRQGRKLLAATFASSPKKQREYLKKGLPGGKLNQKTMGRFVLALHDPVKELELYNATGTVIELLPHDDTTGTAPSVARQYQTVLGLLSHEGKIRERS